jgi:hypothetical protein
MKVDWSNLAPGHFIARRYGRPVVVQRLTEHRVYVTSGKSYFRNEEVDYMAETAEEGVEG